MKQPTGRSLCDPGGAARRARRAFSSITGRTTGMATIFYAFLASSFVSGSSSASHI
jgi:hypothetical protein